MAIQPAHRKRHQGQRLATECRVLDTVDPAQGLRPRGQALIVVAHLLDQQQIEFTALVQAAQLRPQAAGDFQAHPGMLHAKGREQRHQALGGEVLRHRQAQHPFALLMNQHVRRFVMQGQNAPGIRQQALAFRSSDHAALIAIEQLAAEALF